MAKEVKKQIERLRNEIRRHDYLYYVLNRSEITDRQYDKLFAELQGLEQANPQFITADSPTQRVSEQPLEGFKTVRHTVPMLSIDNTYSADELRAFDERIHKQLGEEDYDYVVELKIDGVASSLRYEHGLLVTGATRGDGRVGDDVTANVRTIKGVPLVLMADKARIPEVLEVRGEVYMPTRAFVELNKQREKAGEALFANPRNATAGSLKLLDSRITAQRKLAFFAYATGEISQPLAKDHYETLQIFRKLGLPVNPHIKHAKDIDEVIKVCDSWDNRRAELEYQIDGMVVKVNRLDHRKILGYTGRAPRWCISYKFAAEQAETVVESIDVQVGKGGTLTPVANLTPVFLAGTTVKRASLHNFDQLNRLDVRVGDTVVVEKAGEIIPQVVEVKMQNRKSSVGETFAIPTKCPNCGGQVKKDDNGVYLRCDNPNCVAKLKERLEYFVGKGQMDIDSLGPALIEQLVDEGLVKTFADLYKLDLFQIMRLERMADKSAANAIEAIEESKKRPLWRLIAALGIPNVGRHSAQILADKFSSLNALMVADKGTLQNIDQVGPTMAESVYEYFRNAENRSVIKELLAAGVKLEQPKKAKAKGKLAGKTIVVTGTLRNFSRQQAEQAIRDAGGKVTSSVSKNTDFVLTGKEPGSKLNKARELGIEVIDEDEFTKRIPEGLKSRKKSDS